MRNAAFWSSGNIAVVQAIAFFRILVLARLLDPEQLGLFGIASAALAAFSAALEFGPTSYFVVQKIADDPDALVILARRLWTIDLARRALIALVLILSSKPIAAFYGDQRLSLLIVAVSVAFILSGFTSVALMLDQRSLDLKKPSIHRALSEVAGTVMQIVAVLVWPSSWGLAIGFILAGAAASALSWVVRPFPIRFDWNWTVVRQTWEFGKHMMVVSFLTFVTTRLDDLVVGRYLGSAAAGLYGAAYRISSAPVDLISSVLSPVLAPAYRNLSKATINRVFCRTGLMAAALLTLLQLVVVAFPLDSMRILYGPKFDGGASVVPPLCLLAILRGLAKLYGPLLLASGRPDLDSIAKQLEVLVFVPCLFSLVPSLGMSGAAWAGVLSYLVALLAREVFVVLKTELDLVPSLVPMLATTLTCLVCIVLLSSEQPVIARLAIVIGSVVLTFGTAYFFTTIGLRWRSQDKTSV